MTTLVRGRIITSARDLNNRIAIIYRVSLSINALITSQNKQKDIFATSNLNLAPEKVDCEKEVKTKMTECEPQYSVDT